MRYRIKITTFKNGRQEFTAYFLAKSNIITHYIFGGSWLPINCYGEAKISYIGICDKREKALNRIDLHFKGNTTKQKIEFEYITK